MTAELVASQMMSWSSTLMTFRYRDADSLPVDRYLGRGHSRHSTARLVASRAILCAAAAIGCMQGSAQATACGMHNEQQSLFLAVSGLAVPQSHDIAAEAIQFLETIMHPN